MMLAICIYRIPVRQIWDSTYLGETVWFRAGRLGRVVGANDTLRDAAAKV